MSQTMFRFVGLLILSTAVFSQAQQNAVTDDGQRVLLNADGTWEVNESTVSDSVAGIRGVTWGMNINDVRQAEEMTPMDDYAGWLSYRLRIAGLPAVLEYSFDNDQLVSATYRIQDTYSNKNEYITDYARLKSLLETKYGPPTRDEQIWRNIQFKGNPQQWGVAVQMGHLVYVTEWFSDSKTTALHLKWSNNSLDFSILYYTLEFVPEGVQDSAQQALGDL